MASGSRPSSAIAPGRVRIKDDDYEKLAVHGRAEGIACRRCHRVRLPL